VGGKRAGASLVLGASLCLMACTALDTNVPAWALGAAAAGPGATETHEIQAKEISESSGLVASRRHPGVFWTHNDSGDSPRIFAIDRLGAKLAEYAVEGAQHVDWEDIAIDDAGELFLGDFGNNRNDRRDLRVYVIPEPDPTRSGSIRVDRVLPFRYADQRDDAGSKSSDFDCEAMIYHDGALYLFSKHRGNTRTKLYRLPIGVRGVSGDEVALEPQGTLELGSPSAFGVVTAADLRADGRYVALLTYLCVFIYERRGNQLFPTGPVARIEFDTSVTRQAESVAWDGDALIIGNEQRRLFRLERPLAPSLWRFPPKSS